MGISRKWQLLVPQFPSLPSFFLLPPSLQKKSRRSSVVIFYCHIVSTIIAWSSLLIIKYYVPCMYQKILFCHERFVKKWGSGELKKKNKKQTHKKTKQTKKQNLLDCKMKDLLSSHKQKYVCWIFLPPRDEIAVGPSACHWNLPFVLEAWVLQHPEPEAQSLCV